MLAALGAKFGLVGQIVDLLAHLVKGAVDALAFELDILGHHLADLNARLVEDRLASAQPFDQGKARHGLRTGLLQGEAERVFFIHKIGVGDQFRKHHCGGLQSFDLDIFVTARIDMLNAQNAHRAFPVNDRHAGKGMKFLLARFRPIGKIGMRARFGEVERLDVLGDHTGQPLANRHARDVDGGFVEAARRKQFEHPFAQKVDRTHLADQAFADNLDHAIKLGLRVKTRGHDLVQASEDLAGGCSGAHEASSLGLSPRKIKVV